MHFQFVTKLTQRSACSTVPGQEQVDRSPGQPHQAVHGAPGGGGHADELVGKANRAFPWCGPSTQWCAKDRASARAMGSHPLSWRSSSARIAVDFSRSVVLFGGEAGPQALCQQRHFRLSRPAPGVAGSGRGPLRASSGFRAPTNRRALTPLRPGPDLVTALRGSVRFLQNKARASANRPSVNATEPAVGGAPVSNPLPSSLLTQLVLKGSNRPHGRESEVPCRNTSSYSLSKYQFL